MNAKEKLFNSWLDYRKAETKLKDLRLEIEKEIEKLYETDFNGNSKTFNENDIGFKVNIKKNIVHKLDEVAWKSIRNEFPEELRPEKISFSVDVKGFNWLKENEEELYRKVSDCVEIKENKPTIKIEKTSKE